jgi:SAM-dependent methyltransferase
MDSPGALFQRFRTAVAARGVAETLRRALRKVYRTMNPSWDKHPFDREHGTDTSSFILANALSSEHENAKFITAYYGTHPSLFRGVIDAWRKTLTVPLESYSFFDIGCGKGRVLLMASEFPFQSVVGIDLYESLIETAQQNIRLWLQRPRATDRIEARLDDALTLEFESGPLVLYLYHPFETNIMTTFVERLRDVAQMRVEPVDLIYMNSLYEETILAVSGIQRIANGEISFTAKESAAHAFEDKSHRFSIYRFANHEAIMKDVSLG